jgi:hypothetical protein
MSTDTLQSETVSEENTLPNYPAGGRLAALTGSEVCPSCGLPTIHVTKECCIEALRAEISKLKDSTRRFDERYGCECAVCNVMKPLRDLKYQDGKMVCLACIANPPNDQAKLRHE